MHNLRACAQLLFQVNHGVSKKCFSIKMKKKTQKNEDDLAESRKFSICATTSWFFLWFDLDHADMCEDL